MIRAHRTVPLIAANAAVLAAAGLLIAGCGPNSSGSSGASGKSTTAPGKTTSPAAKKSSGGTSGGVTTGITTLFPATVGNTWVYDETLSGHPTGTATNKIVGVTPDSDGEKVTISVATDISGLSNTGTKLTYQLYSNGSIGVPLAQGEGNSVTIKSGGIVWPSQAELDSGQAHTSTLTLMIKVGAQVETVKGDVTVKGEGTQSVTVPAGTYQATVVDEVISEKFDGISLASKVLTYLVPNVGPVKSVLSTVSEGKTVPETTDVLKSFTRG